MGAGSSFASAVRQRITEPARFAGDIVCVSIDSTEHAFVRNAMSWA